MKVTLIRITPEAINAIEIAASNCYDSDPTDGKIMNSCYNSGHYSVLEFADVHFKVEGASRACINQLTRHRTGKFEQQSQRYVNKSGFEYVTPPSIKGNTQTNKFFEEIIHKTQDYYDFLIDMGVPKEDARYVLPNACDTVIDVKFDLRNFIHLCNERLCTRAQWEIREVVKEMVKLVVEQEPKFKPWLVPKCEIYTDCPFCTEAKSCGRHPKLKDIYRVYEENKKKEKEVN